MAFRTLMNYPPPFAFPHGGPSLVFDSSTCRLNEPCADDFEPAMGFPIGTTCAPIMTEAQRWQILGEVMAFDSMA